MKKAISYIIALMMVVTMMPYTAFAAETLNDDAMVSTSNAIESDNQTESELQTDSYIWIDPQFEEVADVEYLEEADGSGISTFSEEEDALYSYETAGAAIKGYLENRVPTFTINYNLASDLAVDGWTNTLAKGILDAAVAHTGESVEGDALRWTYSGYKASYSYYTGEPYYDVTITFTMDYFYDSDQEYELLEAIESLKSELDLDGKTDYEKVKGIYDYMCNNITYDYTNLDDDDYKLKYSAYAALINKTAVCEGYAVLFYRLALEYGIDARVIVGTSNGEGHAWNIVKLGGKYYNLDATWDAPRAETGYEYFLKADGNFPDHTAKDEYLTEAFQAAYPISDTDYVPGQETEDDGILDDEYGSETENPEDPTGCAHANTEIIPAVAATCTETGLTEGEKCLDCGIMLAEPIVTDILEHTPNNPICTEPQICRVCGIELAAAKGDHKLEWIKNGDLVDNTCSVCGYVENKGCIYKGMTIGSPEEISVYFSLDTTVTVESDDSSIVTGAVTGSSTLITGSAILYGKIIKITPAKIGTTKLTIKSNGAIVEEYYIDINSNEVSVNEHIGYESLFEYTSLYDEDILFDKIDGVNVKVVSKTKQTSTLSVTVGGNTVSHTEIKYIYELMTEYLQPGDFDFSLYGSQTGEIYRINANITDHALVIEPAVSPTCTQSGLTEGAYCSICNKEITKQKEIPATGHDMVYGEVIPATCTEPGYTSGGYCNNCDYTVESGEIPATGHKAEVVEAAVEPNCTDEGSTESTECSACGEVLTQKEMIPALAHTYGEYKVTEKAGFGKAGVKTATCTGCKKATKTAAIAAVAAPKLSAATYTFNNKAKKPTVKIAGISSKLYIVTYAKGRKNVGKYSVKVTFKANANYTGSRTVYFKINPAKPTRVKVTKGKKQIKVSWKKPAKAYRSQIDGYEVRYAASKSKLEKAKPKKYSGKALTNKTIKKLKSKKTYYVQVRTYNKIGKTTYTSAWTTAKKIKTK